MNEKKELLIQIVTNLQPHWEMADGILALLKSSYITQETIDGLIKTINTGIKNSKNKLSKSKLEKWLEKIQKIKEVERSEDLSEEELDQLLEDI